MRVGPSITAWAPTVVRAPMTTSGPITAKGPTLTPSPSCARGETSACGSTMGWTVSFGHLGGDHHVGTGHFGGADERRTRELPDPLEAAHQLGGEDQLVPRLDRLAEARLVDADKIELGVRIRHHAARDEGEDARGLGQGLDDHDAGHDGPLRKVACEKRLIAA